jgi:predicted amidohydrolase
LPRRSGRHSPILTVVPDPAGRDGSALSSLIDEIVREGARRMLAEAPRAEVAAYVAQFAASGMRRAAALVVRNGYHESREVLTSAGAVQVTAPRVNDRRTDPQTGQRMRFSISAVTCAPRPSLGVAATAGAARRACLLS